MKKAPALQDPKDPAAAPSKGGSLRINSEAQVKKIRTDLPSNFRLGEGKETTVETPVRPQEEYTLQHHIADALEAAGKRKGEPLTSEEREQIEAAVRAQAGATKARLIAANRKEQDRSRSKNTRIDALTRLKSKIDMKNPMVASWYSAQTQSMSKEDTLESALRCANEQHAIAAEQYARIQAEESFAQTTIDTELSEDAVDGISDQLLNAHIAKARAQMDVNLARNALESFYKVEMQGNTDEETLLLNRIKLKERMAARMENQPSEEKTTEAMGCAAELRKEAQELRILLTAHEQLKEELSAAATHWQKAWA